MALVREHIHKLKQAIGKKNTHVYQWMIQQLPNPTSAFLIKHPESSVMRYGLK